jgi:archaellum component FlaC
LIEPFSENYLKKLMKKLIRNNDIEDALKRLDRLTQEEARMASAQPLKITNAIDSEVRETTDNVLVVDDRVAGVDERVAGVDERVAGVEERVAGMDERVASVDERVAGVDERVAGVDERVAGVDDRVACVDDHVKDVDDKAVDDKSMAVIDGAQYIFQSIIENCLTPNASRWKRGQGSYPTSGCRCRSDGTFVIPEPHSCWICRLNYPYRESITTGSS